MNHAYKKEDLPSWVHTKAHNWIIHRAFEFIRNNLTNKMPSDIDERYVHYGVSFADRPWYGRPESFDSSHPNGTRVRGVGENLWGKMIDDDCAGPTNNICVHVRYPSASAVDRPNIYLSARWLFSFFRTEDVEVGVDNLAHYLNDQPVRADGTVLSTARLVAGPQGRGAWKIKATTYGVELYRLAREFWPGSEPIPTTFGLMTINNPGRLLNESWIGEATLFEKTAEADVSVTTFLGGNPFIEGAASWPIWVPETLSVEELLNHKPPQSKRVAAIYLGWALHILHDLAVPMHVSNETGQYHSDSENEIDLWIREGKYNHLPILSPLNSSGSKMKYVYSSKDVYYPDIWHDWVKSDHIVADSDLVGKFNLMARTSKQHVNDTHPDRRPSKEASIAAYEHLLDVALKETIDLILVLCQVPEMGFIGTIKGAKRFNTPNPYEPVKKAALKFKRESSPISKTVYTDNVGYFKVDLPKSGEYTVTIEHPDFQTKQIKLSLYRPGYQNAGETRLLPADLLPSGICGYVNGKQGNVSSALGRARIAITGTKSANGVTSSSGEFLVSLPPGRYHLMVTCENYVEQKKDVDVPANRYVSVAFQLKSSLPPGGQPR